MSLRWRVCGTIHASTADDVPLAHFVEHFVSTHETLSKYCSPCSSPQIRFRHFCICRQKLKWKRRRRGVFPFSIFMLQFFLQVWAANLILIGCTRGEARRTIVNALLNPNVHLNHYLYNINRKRKKNPSPSTGKFPHCIQTSTGTFPLPHQWPS